jgi:hypothetical protein
MYLRKQIKQGRIIDLLTFHTTFNIQKDVLREIKLKLPYKLNNGIYFSVKGFMYD